jgi:hypothetical protein
MTREDRQAPGSGHASGRSGPAPVIGALAALGLLLLAGTLQAADYPAYLPHYDADIDLDVAGHVARVRLQATWVNPAAAPTQELVFNAHSCYVVPDGQVGFMAKMLEILRMNPGEAMGIQAPPLEVHKVTLAGAERPFRFEGDTHTNLVVPLPYPVGPGQAVTVVLDLTMHLPQKQGRWGQWCGVTTLSNWLPVFAFYGPQAPRGDGLTPEGKPCDPNAPPVVCWQPTPFIPWHQPFFNEAGHHRVRVTLPADQEVACSGSIVGCVPLPDGRKRVEIHAAAVRDFALLCSARYKVFEGEVVAAPGVNPVRVRVLALPQHEYYAREMVRIAVQALTIYSRWFGPYPWPDFTIAESFFGWNGNECATLVMIDERVFGMPHVGGGYVEYLVSHEVCHQWWYNLVGTNGFCETWMDEAMASHFSHRLLNEVVGRNNSLMRYPRALEWLPNIRREDYRSSGMYGTFGRGERGPVVRDMSSFGHLVDLFNHCYDMGARVVGMIEERLGPTAFLDFHRLIVSRYRYRILRIADYRRELEAYTGQSWQEFFHRWLYGTGLSDWALEKVTIEAPPRCRCAAPWCGLLGWRRNLILCRAQGPEAAPVYRVTVWLRQKAEYDEPTTLGFALPDCPGYPVRVPILPQASSYQIDDPPAEVQVLAGEGGAHVRVEVTLPCEPTQIAVDPDQVLIDRDPSNNFWKTAIRWRPAPVYSFLEETDLTNAYDRWNVIFGPWLYGSAYNDAWYTRSTMLGVRAGAYRTQDFVGGAYAAYRTDFRDVIAGVDGQWDHWPFPRTQVGFNAEHRLAEFYNGNDSASRGVVWGRYIFQYGSSLYLPPMHYLEAFGAYQDNFLPFPASRTPGGERFDRTSTLGLHYRLNYLTPYWDPEGGFQLDLYYQGGVAELPEQVGTQQFSGQFAVLKSLPDLSHGLDDLPQLREAVGPVLAWLGDTRLALRVFGATSTPSRGEFFSMGGGELFRGFDLAQRQGSTVWVGSAEWRVPLAKGLTVDAVDHVMGLRNVYGAAFYDVGNAYVGNHAAGPIAHAVGAGLRFDVTWFGFVERSTLRVDVAKTLNSNSGVLVWFGVNQPF